MVAHLPGRPISISDNRVLYGRAALVKKAGKTDSEKLDFGRI
jgi:hypothetical protein